MPIKSSHRLATVLWLSVLCSGLNSASAAESWMNERERANSVQRDLERLADQARTPNSKSGTAGGFDADAAKAASEAEATRRALDEAYRQRNQQEADSLRAQRQQALDAQFREIDRVTAGMAERWYQRDLVRLANARALLKEGPNANNLSEFCEGMKIFLEGDFTRSGMGDPVAAIKGYEAALAIDETHVGCNQSYVGISWAVARDPEKKHRYFDYASVGIAANNQLDASRRINERWHQFYKASSQRKDAVATFTHPETRLQPPPATPPKPFSKWSKLRNTKDPEALYWKSRVLGLGLLEQPVDIEASREVSCSENAQPYFRNRLNCWLRTNQSPGPDELSALAAMFVHEERDPRNFQGKPELAEIISRRSDYATALAFYGELSLNVGEQIRQGARPPHIADQSIDDNVKHFRVQGCSSLEKAVAMGYYDNGGAAYNLVKCYELGLIKAPSGARSKMFAAMERDGNSVLKQQREMSAAAATVTPVEKTVPVEAVVPN